MKRSIFFLLAAVAIIVGGRYAYVTFNNPPTIQVYQHGIEAWSYPDLIYKMPGGDWVKGDPTKDFLNIGIACTKREPIVDCFSRHDWVLSTVRDTDYAAGDMKQYHIERQLVEKVWVYQRR